MPKVIMIRKHKDKIEIRDKEHCLIANIIVAGSSRTNSTSLSIQANSEIKINRMRILT